MSTKQAMTIAAIVLIIVFVASFTTNIDKMFKRWFGGDTDVDHDPTPLPPGQTEPGFDSNFHVSRLRQVLLTTMYDASPRCDAYEGIMTLNDREFVLVLNEFLNQTGQSLRAAMDNTWYSGCSVFSTQWDHRVYDRMDQLNVYG
ncbi:MAG: hypothetical protein AAFY91_00710 [Bacteroidota bacterium]